ncbi:MAG: hypothetical protein LH702_05840, partial [Phormidesmis sp. CAN_BIN44]|nr:hypothetical protein [Phormidesmis sp. CAN_BIN44]
MSDLSRYARLNYLLSLGTVSSIAAVVAIGLFQEKPAQANSSEPPSSQVTAQEHQSLADSRVTNPGREAMPIKIAAFSTPAKSFLRQFQKSHLAQVNEDELIQKISGSASVGHFEKVSQQVPVFVPSSGVLAQSTQSSVTNRATSEPVSVTATTNSDVGLRLVPAPQKPIHFAPPVSAVRSLNPDSFKNSPTAQVMPSPMPLNETNSTAGLLSQSSNRNSAGSLTSPDRPFLRSTALTPSNLTLQGVYLYQGDQTSTRARLTGIYPLTPSVVFGATLDVSTGNA